jgi:hypothetical protein
MESLGRGTLIGSDDWPELSEPMSRSKTHPAGTRRISIGRVAAALLLSAIVGTVLFPKAASAAPRAPSWGFSVKGSNGYRLEVSTDGRSHVDVFVSDRTAYVEYDAPARVTDGLVEARIGRLGKIAMKFVPSGPPERSDEPNGCHGPRPNYQSGHVEGSFWFRGEHGYTSASTHRASALSERGFTGLCQAGGRPEVPNLVARAKTGRRSVAVSVYFREYEVATHAEITELVGALSIWREVGLAAPLGAASVEPDGSVLISPPSPFSGSVRYSAQSAAARWAGNLSAVVPGLGPVRLAGRQFHVSERLPLPASTS